MNPSFIKGIPQPAGLAVNAQWIYWAEFANPTAVGGGGVIGRAGAQRHRRHPQVHLGCLEPRRHCDRRAKGRLDLLRR